MWSLTTSPIETMPTSASSSTTGMWRKRPCVIVCMRSSSVVVSWHVTTLRVMASEAGVDSAASPRSAMLRMMSRSEMMPATSPLSPMITMAPIFFAPSLRAISSSVTSGRAVETARPLALRIAATFIGVDLLLRPGPIRASGVAAFLAVSSGCGSRRRPPAGRPLFTYGEAKNWNAQGRQGPSQGPAGAAAGRRSKSPNAKRPAT